MGPVVMERGWIISLPAHPVSEGQKTSIMMFHLGGDHLRVLL